MPKTASVVNQTSITGPNTEPTRAVPKRCSENSTARMIKVRGTTNGSDPGAAILSPSTALSTEIAGVIMPSQYSSAAPKMPSAISTDAVRP